VLRLVPWPNTMAPAGWAAPSRDGPRKTSNAPELFTAAQYNTRRSPPVVVMLSVRSGICTGVVEMVVGPLVTPTRALELGHGEGGTAPYSCH